VAPNGISVTSAVYFALIDNLFSTWEYITTPLLFGPVYFQSHFICCILLPSACVIKGYASGAVSTDASVIYKQCRIKQSWKLYWPR